MKINPKTKIAYIDSNVREHEILMYGNGVIQGTGLRIIHFIKTVVDNAHKRLHALNSSLDHSSDISQGDLMDADENGLPHDSGIKTTDVVKIVNARSGIKYHIESGDNVIVGQDNQYFVKDCLYIDDGGYIEIQGAGELIMDYH